LSSHWALLDKLRRWGPYKRVMTGEDVLMCRFLPPGFHLLRNKPKAKKKKRSPRPASERLKSESHDFLSGAYNELSLELIVRQKREKLTY